MSANERKKIGQSLVETGLITREQLNTALEYQKSLGGTLGQIVVKLAFMTDDELTRFLAKEWGLPIADLPNIVLPMDLVKKIPKELIRKHHIVPLHQSGKTLSIATADPADYDAVEELQYATGMQIELHLAPRGDIAKAINDIDSGVARAPLMAGGEAAGEDSILDELRGRSSGKLTALNASKGELREALIPLLIKKGVITRTELHDSVIELLHRKGVIDAAEMASMLRGR